MKLGEKIKLFREMRGMSQDELARRTGYAGRSAVSRIENGERDISQTKIKMFARVLDVDPIELLDDREPTIIEQIIENPERKKLLDFIEQLPDDQLSLYKTILSMPTERLEAFVRLLE